MNDKYSEVIGYSPLNRVDLKKLQKTIKINKKIVDNYLLVNQQDTILVAGTGSGEEASIIRQEFQIRTIGVDLNVPFDQECSIKNKPDIHLQRQDLSSLAFRRDSFSIVYCYHVLEHVNDHMVVLKELCRVMKPGGVLFIGFPNKNRAFSYFGTSQKASFLEKIKWNFNDLKYKLRGKFENRDGAHAGFTQKEFHADASGVFETIIPVRNKYMQLKYPNFNKIIGFIIKMKLEERIFPSNYYICKKANNE